MFSDFLKKGLSQFRRPKVVLLLKTVVLEISPVALIILVPGGASNSANVSSRGVVKLRI
jgi:hypothetical protein